MPTWDKPAGMGGGIKVAGLGLFPFPDWAVGLLFLLLYLQLSVGLPMPDILGIEF